MGVCTWEEAKAALTKGSLEVGNLNGSSTEEKMNKLPVVDTGHQGETAGGTHSLLAGQLRAAHVATSVDLWTHRFQLL